MKHPKLKLTVPWGSIEAEARQQICAVLELPCLEVLAIMPDVHVGYDLCIGGVALLRGVISPSFVGYDIGCGMCHVNTGLRPADLGIVDEKGRRSLFESISAVVPAGLGKAHTVDSDVSFNSACGDAALDKRCAELVRTQLGTLGSGNHFLEIGLNGKGEVGVTIHSGSRRAGYDIASWYMKKGRLLPLSGRLGRDYLEDMNWALDFALENRQLMLKNALKAMGFSDMEIEKMLRRMINENHNHAVMYGKNLVLHRKGATPAEKDKLGIIPANQRDGVWITRGLGNKTFLESASHGAGRALSRKAAVRKGSVSELEKSMKGIICRTDKGVLDEAPWAYKPIDEVLAAQNGVLVDIIDHFKPIIVLKG